MSLVQEHNNGARHLRLVNVGNKEYLLELAVEREPGSLVWAKRGEFIHGLNTAKGLYNFMFRQPMGFLNHWWDKLNAASESNYYERSREG